MKEYLATGIPTERRKQKQATAAPYDVAENMRGVSCGNSVKHERNQSSDTEKKRSAPTLWRKYLELRQLDTHVVVVGNGQTHKNPAANEDQT